jgi:2'-5' RNA ligase
VDGPSPRWQRHFLALLPDDAAREALAAIPVPEASRRANPLDLHVTLAFLGTLAPDGQAAALEAAQQAAGAAPLPEVTLDHLECWDDARVFCATAASPLPGMTAFVERLLEGLAARGLATESKPHRTHVTLARLGKGHRVPDRPLSPPVTWRPAGIVLLASSPIPGPGARYHVLNRVE